MNIEAAYLEMSFEVAAIRDSQSRLKSLISEVAVTPLKQYADSLSGNFDLIDEIIRKRVAGVVTHWCANKHGPVSPSSQEYMSDITNANKKNVTLEEFYLSEVVAAMHALASPLNITVPHDYDPKADELEYALLELEESGVVKRRPVETKYRDDDEETGYGAPAKVNARRFSRNGEFDLDHLADESEDETMEDAPLVAELVKENGRSGHAAVVARHEAPHSDPPPSQERAIVSAQASAIQEKPAADIALDVLPMSTEQAWQLIYGLIGYHSEYVQQTMLPRWQKEPDAFEKDRRFLYGVYIDAIRNSAGLTHISGSYRFNDRPLSLDQMWGHYYSDLSQNVAPLLAAAKLQTAANQSALRRIFNRLMEQMGNVSLIWLLALAIAMIFDGLTTYVSLDQTPMEGPIVLVFSVLITALFQIADQLVISYRKREFEADALAAKFKAQHDRLLKALDRLDAVSDSYVNLSMEKSKTHADLKAAEDNRKMARRGRFWSARIADINILVTAYGFSFMFLNSTEPFYEVVQQIDYILIKKEWENVNLWVFLMVALAVTVSFVVNTAQRTEVLGWSMRRLKRDA